MKTLFEWPYFVLVAASPILVSATVAPPVFSQENPPVKQATVLTFVHDFLEVFYPELVKKGNTLTLAVHHPAEVSWNEISGVYFTVKPERPPDYGVVRYGPNGPISKTRPDPESVLLDGTVWLPPLKHGSRIQEVQASNEGAMKLDALRHLVELRHDWSDDQSVDTLIKQGARFGPAQKNAFISTLPLAKSQRFLGRLKIVSVEFQHLDWTVRADALFLDGTKAKYIFEFEPYEGKLISLNRLD